MSTVFLPFLICGFVTNFVLLFRLCLACVLFLLTLFFQLLLLELFSLAFFGQFACSCFSFLLIAQSFLRELCFCLINFRLVMQCNDHRSEEHTSELQSLMRISYAVFCLKKKQRTT